MRFQGTVEYIIFVSIVVLIALVAAGGVIYILKAVKDGSEVLEKFSSKTGVSLNGL